MIRVTEMSSWHVMLPRSHYWRDCNLFTEEAQSYFENYYQQRIGLSFYFNQSSIITPSLTSTSYRILPTTIQLKPTATTSSTFFPYVLWWQTPGAIHQIQPFNHYQQQQQTLLLQNYQRNYRRNYQKNRRQRHQRNTNEFIEDRYFLRGRTNFNRGIQERTQVLRGMETRYVFFFLFNSIFNLKFYKFFHPFPIFYIIFFFLDLKEKKKKKKGCDL